MAVATLEDEALSSPTVQPTEASSAEGLVDEIVAAVEAARNRRTQAVGVGVPSVVEFQTGHVRSSVNLHMEDFDLRGVLQGRLGLPVFVDNDATLAAVGEAFDERGRALVQNLVMLTVGTGIGGGLVLGGKVYRGSTGAAGELGQALVGASLGDAPKPGKFPQAGSSRWPPGGFWTGSALRSPGTTRSRRSGSGRRGARTSTDTTSSRPHTTGTGPPSARSGASASGWVSGSRMPSTRSIPTRS